MILTKAGLSDKKSWEEKQYILPKFDMEKMSENTRKAPTWIHFGGGNLFRAFHAALAQDMLNNGETDKGIIVVEGYDYEIIEKSYRPNDNLSLLVTLKADGSLEKSVIGSVAESLILDSENDKEYGRLKEVFRNESLQMATFTITEKGYSLVDARGELIPAIKADYEAGPAKPVTYIGKVASLLFERYSAGALPIAMVSTDNCSHNGDKLYAAMNAFAENWVKEGKADKGFAEYINDASRVSFPWSMIDKITPRPDEDVKRALAQDGLEGLEPVITSKNTYVAPFVNAEETQYLVIEDKFPNGRPALEKAGVIFTDRETVDKVEKMKVCTCLNPLHTALAIFGCLRGYTRIFEEMRDSSLVALIKNIGYKEGLPVVVNPGVLNPEEFIDTVVGVRLPNPYMPDAPQRIATDTSQKLPIRFGETVKNYMKNGLDMADLKYIPLVYAGWMRYLMAIDDKGERFELSSDPMLDTVCPVVADIKLGDKVDEAKLQPILSNQAIWGLDLYESGLVPAVVAYFNRLIQAPGAIEKVLAEIEY